ncbi:MAG TPA: DNA recombination protein RmuC [Gaiellaceae bacterium]|nr:DNA recombination protein RmuC [Gaiellaceae bacterium]
MIVVALIVGVLLGAAAAWLVARARNAGETAALRIKLDHERDRAAEKVTALQDAEREFSDRFDALAADALRKNTESFLELASGRLGQKEQAVAQLVQPVRETLASVQKEMNELERSRRQDYGSLRSSVQTLVQTSDQVRSETARLATALRSSEVRGAWGQMQLRNALETAGMLAHCDFEEEVHTVGDGRAYRPDVVVRLPGGRRIVIDAKTPLKALLDAMDAPEENKSALLADYARHVREHVKHLSSKSYWDQLEGSPEYVVMFLPGEGFFRTAVEADPALLGSGGDDRVILASPMMLIALLRTVGCIWNEEKVAESARAVNRLGQELYERLTTMTEHLVTLGKRLDGSVQAYNQAVGSLERRVLPKARELTDHGVRPKKELPELEGVDRSAQPPQTVAFSVAKPAEPAALPPAADAA